MGQLVPKMKGSDYTKQAVIIVLHIPGASCSADDFSSFAIIAYIVWCCCSLCMIFMIIKKCTDYFKRRMNRQVDIRHAINNDCLNNDNQTFLGYEDARLVQTVGRFVPPPSYAQAVSSSPQMPIYVQNEYPQQICRNYGTLMPTRFNSPIAAPFLPAYARIENQQTQGTSPPPAYEILFPQIHSSAHDTECANDIGATDKISA